MEIHTLEEKLRNVEAFLLTIEIVLEKKCFRNQHIKPKQIKLRVNLIEILSFLKVIYLFIYSLGLLNSILAAPFFLVCIKSYS